MPRLKRTASKVIGHAAARAAGMESIHPELDLGGDMTLTAYKATIAEAQDRQAAYNTLLAQADEARNLLDAAEEKTSDYSDRMLAAVAGKFGRASNEYEKAGGTRKSDRRRHTTPRVIVSEAKAA